MKLRMLIFIVCSMLFYCLEASQSGEDNPVFTQPSSFEKLCARAKSEDKPILLLISGNNAASFKVFKNKVLSDSAVIDLYTRNFLCYNVDAESKEGKKLVTRYNAIGFPTIIYLSPEKEIIYRSNGSDKVHLAASEAMRVLKVVQAYQQVKKQVTPSQTASAFGHKTQKEIAIEYAMKDKKAGKTDAEKLAFEYTLNSSQLKTFRKVYLKTMEKNN